MKKYLAYAKHVKKQIVILIISLIFCTSSSKIFFSDIVGGWTRDQDMGVLHTLAFGFMGVVGITGIIWCINTFWRQYNIEKRRKILGFCMWGYIAVQLVMGVMVGMLGVLFEKIIGLSYATNKEVLFYTANFTQAILLSMFIFIIVGVGYLKEVNKQIIRKHQDKIIKGIGIGILFCVVTSSVSGLWEGSTNSITKAILESLGIITISIYYGTRLEGDY